MPQRPSHVRPEPPSLFLSCRGLAPLRGTPSGISWSLWGELEAVLPLPPSLLLTRLCQGHGAPQASRVRFNHARWLENGEPQRPASPAGELPLLLDGSPAALSGGRFRREGCDLGLGVQDAPVGVKGLGHRLHFSAAYEMLLKGTPSLCELDNCSWVWAEVLLPASTKLISSLPSGSRFPHPHLRSGL